MKTQEITERMKDRASIPIGIIYYNDEMCEQIAKVSLLGRLYFTEKDNTVIFLQDDGETSKEGVRWTLF